MIHPTELLSRTRAPLTRRQAKLAEFILQRPEEVVFMTAAQLAKESGVSDATVVRLAQVLGFGGFSEMKRHLQGAVVNRLDTVSRLKRTASRIRSAGDLIAEVVRQDAKNLAQTAVDLKVEHLSRIAQVLKESREIHIIGLRSAHSLAALLASTLGFLGKRVRLIVPGTGEMWREVSGISRGSVLVAISFPRYTRLTVEVAKAVQEAGGTVVSLTDSPFSPLAAFSEHLLTAPCRIDSFIESYVCMLSLVNALVTALAFMEGTRAIDHLKRMEMLWEEKNIYYQAEKRTLPSWASEDRGGGGETLKKGRSV
jgi:DNA-binding MurR/RpiR family transcriptional regulator